MKRPLSLALATFVVLACVLLIPMAWFLQLLQQPGLVDGHLDPEYLYAAGIPAVVLELQKDPVIRELRGTVLELTERDLTRLLQTSFTPEDVAAKAHQVHQDIVAHVPRSPVDSFQFFVSLKQERPVVVGHAKTLIAAKLRSRPECDLGQFAGIAWMGIKELFTDIPERKKLHDLPKCRPPGFVQKSILESVDRKLDHMVATGKDSIPVRPRFSADAHRGIQEALFLGREFPLCCALVLAALAGLFALHREEGAAGLGWVGGPLVLAGGVLAVVAGSVWLTGRGLDPNALLRQIHGPPISESTGQWLTVVAYLLQVTLRLASYHLLLGGTMALLAGLLLVRQSRRARHAAASPIDTRSPQRLASATLPPDALSTLRTPDQA